MKTFPRDCGQRLLSHVIDERASNNHKRPFAAIPKTSNPGDGYRDISYTTFANAINRLAQWLLAELGPPVRKHESVVYIAAPDLRYHILCMAAVKAGYVIFLVSPRNSHEAFASLMEECGATRLLTDEKRLPAVASIQRARHMQTSAIPLLDELLDPRPVPSIELLATWEEYRFVPFVQIHSSGSTGIPKLVTINHGSITGFDAYQLLDEAEVLERLGDERIFVSFPPFHIAGIMYGLTAPCWFDSTVVLPPSVPLTADLVNEIHLQANVDYSALAPSVVTDLAKNPVYLENISRLKGLAFAGGPLSESTGKLVAERTNMNAGYGASEWIVAPQLPKAREDWAYFCFNEKQGGYEFRERDQGLYELCIVRKAEYHLFQPVFVNFPDIDEFCSKDLFTKHPTKPGLWKYASRFDDIIVFSNGEKLNPVTFESLVTTSPHVKGCIVIGQGRFQATLLVELADAEERQPLDKIWPIVERANEPTVKHGRITKDHILFTTLDKPLPRAGKGTVQRAAANKLYASEIDEHYANIDKKRQPSEKCPFLALGTIAEAKQSLAEYFNKELGTNEVTNSTDLFSLGLDSLQVINLVRAINSSRPDLAIDAKLVYDYPTIDKLSSVLLRGNNEHYDYSNDSDDEELKDRLLLKESREGTPVNRSKGLVVLLTGSTGNFGSYVLDILLQQSWISQITCLNRSSSARERQLQSHRERGLTTDLSRVTFQQADFSHPQLGLTPSTYHHLSLSADLIIHNAWPVDFNLNFSTFKPSIDGVQNLINFSLSHPTSPARLVFISSIGATSNYGAAASTSRSKIPEVELTDWKVARTGYGQSKLLSERLLSHAARELGLRATIVRVGQLGGPVGYGEGNGMWNEREWVPRLIRTSLTLGALPGDLGPGNEIDWVPVDVAAKVLVELCEGGGEMGRGRGAADHFHLVSPHSTPWDSLVPAITAYAGSDLKTVSFVEWVELLKRSGKEAGGAGVEDNPAIKLVDFFDNLRDRAVRFPKAKSTLLDTKQTVKVSRTLADLGAVSADAMTLWMRQWNWEVKPSNRSR
ncbi:hypothetical protein DOTSEDRAFT_175863 [Dothistroma septosporum NZE10]|uniref:Carrier domain-containing protein n=1 Tax=Dothistroma septosporum (strain NZE10 / CBS 128990) TaxID=675120 RepID=N1PM79_DOTSN|nr:hypothetical protein DOTSEDRAFT_175863 [Dothistroma septosporum NZE10]